MDAAKATNPQSSWCVWGLLLFEVEPQTQLKQSAEVLFGAVWKGKKPWLIQWKKSLAHNTFLEDTIVSIIRAITQGDYHHS
jgi:hypothetical protein